MALLIRELTSGIAYVMIVAPVMVGGYDNLVAGTMSVFADTACWLILFFTALIGMVSFFCWYTAIDLIGAAKALCLNVTYSFWAVVFTFVIVGGSLSLNIIVGSILVVTGVAVATLVSRRKNN